MERINIRAGRRSGKPCIRDTRITVYDVLGYLASGMSESEILADFPDLTREDILACYAYASPQTPIRHSVRSLALLHELGVPVDTRFEQTLLNTGIGTNVLPYRWLEAK